MKSVAVFLAPGFEEIEAVTVIDVLRRADVKVVVAGLASGAVTGSHGITVTPDTTLDEIGPEDFDMAVLPGGMPGTTNLDKDPRVAAFLKIMKKSDKYVCAICAAPIVLKTAGVLTGKAVTSHPAMHDALRDQDYRQDRVVADGKVVTSCGPGTAMEFALELVSILAGPDKARELGTMMLATMESEVKNERPGNR